MVADLSVDGVGEIDRGRSERHFLDHALGREHIDYIMKEIELDRIHELTVVR